VKSKAANLKEKFRDLQHCFNASEFGRDPENKYSNCFYGGLGELFCG
jgi:hypothetical protein